LQLYHSGCYRCGGQVVSQWKELEWVTMTVSTEGPTLRSVPVSRAPGGQVALGDSLVLSCAVAVGTGPLSFSWHREGLGAPLGTGPHLELRHVGDNDSGQYQCRVGDRDSVAESDPLNVTIL
ncbi:FCRL2 protein, partial [Passerina amoena]|nr:FCRL2 protein [Passerina amoena]